MFTSRKELDFFCTWYYRAQLDQNYDPERQFFYLYALLDHLMKTLQQEQQTKLPEKGLQLTGGEKGLLKYFLYHTLYECTEHEYFETYNPFKLLKKAKKTQIISKLELEDNSSVFNEDILPPFEKIASLFMVIYKIRCNLFHGEADLQNYNSNFLIEEANIVLKSFMDRLFTSKINSGDEQ